MEIASKSSAEAIEDFRLRRLNDTVDGGDGITPENVDEELFVSLVDAVSASVSALDAQVDQAISKSAASGMSKCCSASYYVRALMK